MKGFGIFLLMLGIMLHMMSASLILVHYEVNKAYITEKFCVNRDKPAVKCNGKCHLVKQIKADAESKSAAPVTETEMLALVFTIEPISRLGFQLFGVARAKTNSPYAAKNYSTQLQSIFHPPQV